MSNRKFYAVLTPGVLTSLGVCDGDINKAFTVADNLPNKRDLLGVVWSHEIRSMIFEINSNTSPTATFAWDLHDHRVVYFGEYPDMQEAARAEAEAQLKGDNAKVILNTDLLRGWESVYVQEDAKIE